MVVTKTGSFPRAWRFDDVVVDGGGFQVLKAGKKPDLEPRAVRVLLHLVENRGRLVTKDELVAEIWGGVAVTDNAVTRIVAQLRKGLGDHAKQARYIETIPTQGYRFIAEVEAADGVRVAGGSGFRRAAVVAVALAASGAAGWAVLRTLGRSTEAVTGTPVQVTTSPGLDGSPSLSPDGNSMAYASDRSGGFEIYTRPMRTGGNEIPITGDGEENIQPAWSPDGQWIAYYSARRGEIRVVAASGGRPRTVALGSEPQWSPDSRHIVFRAGGFISVSPVDRVPPVGSTLWRVSAEGGEARALTKPGEPEGAHGYPAWMADGKILFLAHGARSTVWSVDAGSGALARVREVEGTEMAVNRATGRLYTATGTPSLDFQIQSYAPDGSKARVEARTGTMIPRDLAMSADGRELLYSLHQMTSNLWAAPLGNGDRARALTHDTSFRNTFPAISPDGGQVAYMSRLTGARGDIFLIGPGERGRQLTISPRADVAPSWSADGNAIYFTAGVPGRTKGPYEIRKLELEGGREAVVAQAPEGMLLARMSPDESKAVFHRLEGGQLSLWVLDVKSGSTRRVSGPGQSIGYGAWSRNGRWLAAEMDEGESTHTVILPAVILPADGGSVERVTKTAGQHWVSSWSPEGGRLAMASQRGGVWNIWTVGRDGTGERMLTGNRLLRVFVRYPDWSLRGDRIVYEQAETKGNIYRLSLR